jgi:hypothetical protein
MAETKIIQTAEALKQTLQWGKPSKAPKAQAQSLAESLWPHLRSEAKPVKPEPKKR